jgi:SPW repeat
MVNWRGQDYVALLVGIWVAASPWMLGFDGDHPVATWMAVIVGAAIVILAAIDLDAPSKIDEWALIAIGLALMASPWILGFAEHRPATTSMFLSGVVVVALTAWELLANDGWGKPGDHAHGS